VPKKAIPVIGIIFLMLTFSSCTCIYFNTFHNIRKNFNTAENSRKDAGRDKATGPEVKQYTDAITKASKVLERHPTSGYVDDALYIIGASYFYLGDYSQAARKFKELFANYPQSEYIRPSRILLARSKLMLKEEAEAVVVFEQIFQEEKDRKMKADAARALGQYYFDGKEYEKANVYFMALKDSLGDANDKLKASTYVADGYFDRFLYDKALDSYDEALKYSPDTLQYFRINYRMAECEFFMSRMSPGLERLGNLAANQLYYDSLTVIRLKMAEGYAWDGDLNGALNAYEKITVENPKTVNAALAYYEMGLIYQYDYENMDKALEYYKKARDEHRSSSIYADAARRVSMLGLLEQYAKGNETKEAADSTGKDKQLDIDQLSENEYLLGELFYFDLEKPDSALHAFATVVDKYPQSKFAPQSMISMAYLYREDFADTAKSDSLYRRVLADYPKSDQAQEVIKLLGLAGTVADTGYAAKKFEQAETYFEAFQKVDSSEHYLYLEADSGRSAVVEAKGRDYLRQLDLLDSATDYYRVVADSFPYSSYNVKAKYVLLYIFDKYITIGDSSLIDLYSAFVDSFPDSKYAEEISKKYNIRPTGMVQKKKTAKDRQKEEQKASDSLAAVKADSSLMANQGQDTTVVQAQAQSKFITDENGKVLNPANPAFLREDYKFEYPLEAVAMNIETKLYFHIKIDFLGYVVDLVLMNPTQSPELNQRVTELVKNTRFDQSRIPTELFDTWFWYSKEIRIPENLRR
jgi:tetratricopeptide (TPR) repeat protein